MRWSRSARGGRSKSRVKTFSPMFEGFERREMLSVTITPIADVSVPATKTSFVPVQGTDSAGNRIDYTVTSGNASVQATVRSGHPFLKLSVANYGDMVFQLFDDLAPNTVTKIKSLVDSGFYNGLTFHRVVPNFVIQGGDPKGDGTGGPGFSFDNEYNANAIFSGSGQLAMANSGPNTNGSQFFVTVGPQRFLDFNYNLFGQLVSGESVLKAIDSVPTNSADRPLSTVTITNASIINDNSDTVLLIKAPAGSGSSTITVTGTDSVDNSTDQETFQVNYQADTTVDPPFLNPIGAQSTKTDTPVSFTLSSTDLQNNPVTYSAKEVGGSNAASVVVNGNVVTVTPKTGYEGTIQVQVAVQAAGATSRGSTADPKDYKTISVKVAAETTTPPPVTTPPTNTTSTGNPRVFVRAPSGVSQHAINLTSRELSRVLGTLHKVMVRFRITGDKTRLEHALTVLAGRIPYGRRNLLPVWKATLAAADTGTAAGRKALGGQLKNNLVTYLSNQIGVTLNVVHSHGSYWSDRLVKFNGRA